MVKINVKKTASRGIVIGKAYVHREVNLEPARYTIEKSQIEEEIHKFDLAKEEVRKELELLSEKNDIFAAHLGIVDDITLHESVITKITEETINIEYALEKSIDEFVQIFEAMDDEYMKERAADVKDVGKRLMAALKGEILSDFSQIKEQVILVAKDLFPSDTAKLNLDYITAFITEEGGVTSHVSIMAKGLGLPALVGVEGILSQVREDDSICMDAETGEIIINPEEAVLEEFKRRAVEYQKEQQKLEELKNLAAETTDGRYVSICANVGTIEEVKVAAERNVDGIGLFRSEFLYMENTHFPTEEEQFEVYKQAAQLCQEELTIRTLDIGGDKELKYYEFEKEENPFLGWRAIRISLELKEMFRTQLRAILRASEFGHIRIMFPMIISLEEFRQAKELVEECKQELIKENISFDKNIELGIMIETPASVLLAEELAKEVDFFSIGTNDLTQYLLAVDRGNKKIAHLYQSYHPAVLKAIYHIIQAGHREHIKVGMCGEFASDVKATKILLGMGLDEFSMSSGEANRIKEVIRNSSYKEAQSLAKEIIACKTIEEVKEKCN